MLQSGLYKANSSTQELLFSSVIDFAQTENAIKVIAKIFLDGDCVVLNSITGLPVEGLEVSIRQKHSMVKRIYSSKNIPLEVKQEAMAKIEA